MAMSFTSSTEAEVKIIETEFGEKIVNIHLISIDDLKALEAMTVTGAGTTSWAHTTIYKDAVSETVHKTTDIEVETIQINKLNAILAKY